MLADPPVRPRIRTTRSSLLAVMPARTRHIVLEPTFLGCPASIPNLCRRGAFRNAGADLLDPTVAEAIEQLPGLASS